MSQGFQFKQFFVSHQHCAMKVGTDGVLLGLWAALPVAGTVLDLGTGSGLIALMLAQRSRDLTITGLELDMAASVQAKDNAQNSPFAKRLKMVQGDMRQWQAPATLVVSNPPYFDPGVRSADPRRDLARYGGHLPAEVLAAELARLSEHSAALVLPWQSWRRYHQAMVAAGFHLARCCAVYGHRRSHQPTRALLQWQKTPLKAHYSALWLKGHDGQWSRQFRRLGKDFYLAF